MTFHRARSSQSGWTLIHCLMLLATALVISNAGFLLVKTQKDLALNAAFSRTAEALADGALEMALAHIAKGETSGTFSVDLPTGKANAEIIPASGENQFKVKYEGVAMSEVKERGVRRYSALAEVTDSGETSVQVMRSEQEIRN